MRPQRDRRMAGVQAILDLPMTKPNPTPHAVLTFNSKTNLFGFRVYFEGQKPHNVMETFQSREAAQAWLDPLNERIWEETPNDTGDVLAISRGFKAGSVAAKML